MHLAVADIAAAPLLDPGEVLAIATRDQDQRRAGAAMGFAPL